ncbi:MAG TPA: TIGR00341 family protein [Balneolaceae bacterium]|nr:TIGR00341 family protein [Balneolaceae bacterium]
MPLRQIEVVVPCEHKDEFADLLEDDSVEHYWNDESKDAYILKALVDANKTENFLDKAEQIIGEREGFRLVLLAVEATLPRMEDDEEEEEKNGESNENNGESDPWDKPLQGARVSREELYNQISDSVELSGIYIAMVSLSTVVAALGVLRDNTAVVIGAMVIAPLLGPNVGLALSTTLGDNKLLSRSIKSNIAGIAVAFLISVALGFLLSVDESVYQIASRTEVHLSDIALALASGAAGVLAYTIGMSAAVIGVMVAVALLPPLVTAGLLVGEMKFDLAYYAFLLVTTNVICVNLAAVATFILQGVKPRTWYKAEKAKKINRRALALWISLVCVLALLIWLS